MTVLRWILFIPAAVIVGAVASALFRFVAGLLFPDIVEFVVCGAVGAVAMITVGLRVAPRPSAAVKWTLIAITAVLGALAAVGSLLGADKLQAAIGVTMFLVASGFSSMSVEDIAKA